MFAAAARSLVAPSFLSSARGFGSCAASVVLAGAGSPRLAPACRAAAPSPAPASPRRCLASALLGAARLYAGGSLRGASTSASSVASLAAAAAAAPVAAAAAAAPYSITDAPMPDMGVAPRKWGRAVLRGVRGHTKKLSPLARAVAGLALNEAVVLCAFSPLRRAAAVKTALERAARNADFHHALSSDSLMVDRAWTGKHMTSPRLRHHSKGRAGRSHWRTSTINVRVREMTPQEAIDKKRFASAQPSAERRAALDFRSY